MEDLTINEIISENISICKEFRDDQKFQIKWEIIKSEDPPKLKNHTSILFKRELILFGGFDGKNNVNALYSYCLDSNLWKILNSTGDVPKPRNGHSSTLIENKMYIIGGWLGTGQYANDEIYELDLLLLIWKKIILDNQSIGATNMHTADYYNGKIYIFRGANGIDYFNDLIAINLNYDGQGSKNCKIIESSGKSPSPRANHGSSLVFNNLFIFGGWNGLNRLNDMYSINLDTHHWSNIDYNCSNLTSIPIIRAGMPIVCYKSEYLILFGGSGLNSVYLNDLFFYEIKTNTWTVQNNVIFPENIPSERAGHTAVINGREIYIFGGGSVGNIYYSDIHILEIEPPPKIVRKYMGLNGKSYGIMTILSTMKEFFNNEYLSDVILCINDKKLHAHKCVLCLLSEEFERFFSENLKSKKLYSCSSISASSYSNSSDEYEPCMMLDISNYSYKHIHLVIKYLYTCELENERELTIEDDMIFILKIADEFKIKGLKEYAENKIYKCINEKNYHLIYQTAINSNSEDLIFYCNWYYRLHKDEILPFI